MIYSLAFTKKETGELVKNVVIETSLLKEEKIYDEIYKSIPELFDSYFIDITYEVIDVEDLINYLKKEVKLNNGKSKN